MAKISWTNSSGGTWTLGSNWSNGNVPGPNDSVTIAIAPGQGLTSYTVELSTDVLVKSVALDQAAATLQVGDGSGDGLLATHLKLESGTLALEYGTLSGLVADTGGTLALSGPYDYGYAEGTLDGVTWEGNLDPVIVGDFYGSTLSVVGGLILTGAKGVGPGTLTLAQQYGGANFLDTQTLDNATVYLGSSSYQASFLSNSTDGNGAADLTLGAHLLLDIVGQATISDDGQITNDGTISTSGSASLFMNDDYGSTETFTNTGVTAVNEGGYISIGIANVINSGSLTIAAGGTLDLSFQYYGITSFQNEGTILDLGTVVLDGTLTTQAVQALGIDYGATGTLALSNNSTIDNTGGTLVLGVGGIAPVLALDGTILGGTISEAAGGLIAEDGTLDGVTVDGPLSITGTSNSLSIENGLQLAPGATVSVTGNGASLTFDGSDTVDQATLVVGSAGGDIVGDNGGTLTLDSSVQTEVNGGTATFGDYGEQGTIVSAGNIAVSDGAFAGFGEDFSGFVNQGTLSVTGGSTVYVDSGFANNGVISVADSILALGDISASVLFGITLTDSRVELTGVLDATGATVDVGKGTNLGQVVMGISNPEYGYSNAGIIGGTIHDAGGGLLIEGNDSFTDVTYQGVMTIAAPYADVMVSNLVAEDKSGKHSGTIILSGAQSTLEVAGGTTLDNATIDIGSDINRQGGVALAAPSIESASYGEPLDLGANLVIDQTAKYAAIGYGYPATTSDATINAAFNGGQMKLNGDAFINGGNINVGAGEVFTSAVGSLTNSGSILIAAGGTLTLNLLTYYLTLPDTGTSFENAGSIVLNGGTFTEQTGKGVLPVPVRNDASGNISGVGIVATEVANYGTITAVGGELTVSQAVSGGGLLDVSAGATLSLLSLVSAGQVAQFGGADGVLGLSGKHFLGEIGGFANGDTIDLLKLAATSAEFVGNSIVVALTAGGTISLATTQPLNGALTVTGDGHGGSLIAFAGAGAHAAVVPELTTGRVQPVMEPQWQAAIWDAMIHHGGF